MSKKCHKDLVVECDGTLYVRVEAIMHPLIPYIDGLKLFFFGKKRSKPYLSFDLAIDWMERERLKHSKDEYDKKINKLRRIHKEYANG